MTAMKSSYIDEIMKPYSLTTFRDEYWEKKPFFVHNRGRVWPFTDLIDLLKSPEELTKHYGSLVTAFGSAIVDLKEGLANRMLVPGQRAVELYKEGCTLEFDHLDQHIPQLRDMLDEFRTTMGMPTGTFTKSVSYMSPSSSGLDMHFDAFSNFVFQLEGSKTWWFKPNENAPFPLQHYELDEYPYVPEDLREYWTGTPPAAPPNEDTDYLAVHMEPGSFLYVPRGWWHGTKASGSSISLNLTFSQPTWLDLALYVVRKRLSRSPIWREAAEGFEPNGEGAAGARAKDLAARIIDDIGDISASDLTGAQTMEHDSYQIANAVMRQTTELQL
ncbi:JmjC domain-containing protein [Martelella mangrovi]|uniref:Ribosomal protein L16 Arg81 hydroxylase n=1 Tax=Martelella mangrovi TaxID=1397477 RepID=A0ABV2ICS9_9HYPH